MANAAGLMASGHASAIERGNAEVGVPVVGKVNLRKQTLAVVYMCELTNLPFLVTVEKAR